MANGRSFRIGYALVEKKQNSFLQPSLLERAQSQGIELFPIDPHIPLSQQEPFDAILHKISGNLPWTQHLMDYSAAHPEVIIVDPPLAIHRLHNRISMLQAVAELPLSEDPESVSIPKQCVFEEDGSLDAVVARFRFPLIAKPLLVDGSATSHAMSLVFNAESLAKLKPPLVLQEFINHGGVIFKVYVVGEFVQCVKRISLPDVDEDKLKNSREAVSFCQISNTVSSILDLPEIELPPETFILKVASGLRKALGLRLFNFDIIRDVKAGSHYYIIDINYFPGFAKMPGYETALTDFFLGLAAEKASYGSSNAGPC